MCVNPSLLHKVSVYMNICTYALARERARERASERASERARASERKRESKRVRESPRERERERPRKRERERERESVCVYVRIGCNSHLLGGELFCLHKV